MITVQARPQRRRPRSALRVKQPESMAALAPSQRRAAERRAMLRRRGSVEAWLRRLTRD
jgi:hypothetical protein